MCNENDGIATLIERLRKLDSLEAEDELRIEAADALAKLRDEVHKCDSELVDISNKYQAEIAKLRERVNELEFALRSLADTDMPTSVRDYARAALGERASTAGIDIDALIERLRRIECDREGCWSYEHPGKILKEAADALVKLRDALEDCIAFMSSNIVGDVQRLGILKEAYDALGEPND